MTMFNSILRSLNRKTKELILTDILLHSDYKITIISISAFLIIKIAMLFEDSIIPSAAYTWFLKWIMQKCLIKIKNQILKDKYNR